MYAVRVRACAYGKARVRGFALEGNTVEQGDWCLFLGALVSREGGSICSLKRHVCLRRLSHLVGRSGKGLLMLTLFLQMEPSVVRVCCHALARVEGGAAAFGTMRWHRTQTASLFSQFRLMPSHCTVSSVQYAHETAVILWSAVPWCAYNQCVRYMRMHTQTLYRQEQPPYARCSTMTKN